MFTTAKNKQKRSGDDQARDFRGKIPADVIGEAQELPAGVEPDEELVEIIRRTLAGGMDLAQDACAAADEVGMFGVLLVYLFRHGGGCFFGRYDCWSHLFGHENKPRIYK